MLLMILQAIHWICNVFHVVDDFACDSLNLRQMRRKIVLFEKTQVDSTKYKLFTVLGKTQPRTPPP